MRDNPIDGALRSCLNAHDGEGIMRSEQHAGPDPLLVGLLLLVIVLATLAVCARL
jgi:hypothetical protein